MTLPPADDVLQARPAAMIPDTGLEWIVDARGCPPGALADVDAVRNCCERVVDAMRLHVVGQPQWRKFDGPGGVTGLYLLSESHLTCHTFPEFGLICLNVYCCRPRTPPDWDQLLGETLGATAIVVRELTRGLRDELHAGDLRSGVVVGSGDQATTGTPSRRRPGGDA